MKRILAWSILLAAVLCLSGCKGAADGSYEVNVTVEPVQPEPQREKAEYTVGELVPLQWNSGTLGGVCGDGAFYTLYAMLPQNEESEGKNVILRVDYASRTESVLCDTPNCIHSDSSCPAYISGSSSIAYINGKIYVRSHSGPYLRKSGNRDGEQIEEIDIATNKRRHVAALPPSWEVHEFGYTDGAALYGEIFNQDIDELQNVRVDLATGEWQIYQRIQIGWPMGCYKNQFVQLVQKQEIPLQLAPDAAMNAIYSLNDQTEGVICLFDAASQKRTVVRRFPEDTGEIHRAYSGGSLVLGDELYWCSINETSPKGGCQLEKINLITGETTLCAEIEEMMRLNQSLYPAFGQGQRYLKLISMGNEYYGNLIDLKTGRVEKIRWDRSNPESLAGGLQYVPQEDFPLAAVDEEHFLIPVGLYETNRGSSEYSYGIITKESLISGTGSVEYIKPWQPPEAYG